MTPPTHLTNEADIFSSDEQDPEATPITDASANNAIESILSSGNKPTQEEWNRWLEPRKQRTSDFEEIPGKRGPESAFRKRQDNKPRFPVKYNLRRPYQKFTDTDENPSEIGRNRHTLAHKYDQDWLEMERRYDTSNMPPYNPDFENPPTVNESRGLASPNGVEPAEPPTNSTRTIRPTVHSDGPLGSNYETPLRKPVNKQIILPR